jgi:hypothetical protein
VSEKCVDPKTAIGCFFASDCLTMKVCHFLRRASNTGGSVEFFHFSTGKIDSISAIDRPIGVGLSVLRGPNGRASEVLFTQGDQKGSDLMMLEKIW